MVSRFMRRSGVAAGLIAELLGWRPEVVVQVGVGIYHEEIPVFVKEWPDVTFIGFEPNPDTCQAIRETYPGKLVPIAIGAVNGVTNLYSPPQHKDGSSLFKPETGRTVKHVVEVRTLDSLEYLDHLPSKRLLWLDCEGSEVGALLGGQKFLKSVQFVNVEMTASPKREGWGSLLEVHEFLVAAGFKRQWVHTQRASMGQCDGIYVRPELFNPGLCCCPCSLKECAQ